MVRQSSGESGPVSPSDAARPESRADPASAASNPVPSAEPGASRTALSDVEFLRQVGRGVASVYSDILGQPMPDRLVALLKRLEEEEDAPKRDGNRSHL